jgi:outer membrane protein TolC
MRLTSLLLVSLITAVAARPARAQLRLADALRAADTRAVANRVAAGDRSARDAQAIAPLHGILPSARVEASIVRTDDPIGAFGTELRQRRIAQADFDPSRLNFPAPVTNYGGGLVLELPLLNTDAWIARTATMRGASAARASEAWTRLSTRADVVRAFYGAVLAAERVTTLDAAVRAARAHVRDAESLARNGVVTPSDAMLADVKAGELEADLIGARADAALARRGLAVLIGGDGNSSVEPAGTIPAATTLRTFAATDTIIAPEAREARADVDAARLGAEASSADVQRARALLLPRLNAFARTDWNDPGRLFAGERNWTAGVMASWSPFSGASELAEQRGAQARAAGARAMADGAAANARLESERSLSDLRVALDRLVIAEHSAAQGMDAHRIVGRRYDGGLATVVELLDAAAAEVHTATALAKARYDVVVALASRRLALGLDPGAVANLESPASNRPTSEDVPR